MHVKDKCNFFCRRRFNNQISLYFIIIKLLLLLYYKISLLLTNSWRPKKIAIIRRNAKSVSQNSLYLIKIKRTNRAFSLCLTIITIFFNQYFVIGYFYGALKPNTITAIIDLNLILKYCCSPSTHLKYRSITEHFLIMYRAQALYEGFHAKKVTLLTYIDMALIKRPANYYRCCSSHFRFFEHSLYAAHRY